MTEPTRQKRIVPAPILVAVCFGAGWAGTHFAPRRLFPDIGLVGLIASALLFVVALAVGLSGLREFRRLGTPSNPFKPTVAIVTRGVFRYTRNPMYLSFVLVGIGAAMGSNSLWFLVATIVLALLLQFLVILPEERYLSATFADTYDSYRRGTRRWL